MAQREARRLFLVRHGETVGQSSVRYYGRTDLALSDEGAKQIARLAPLLAGEEFAHMLSSPMQRAVQSAQILFDAQPGPALPRSTVEEFLEVDFGRIEGLTAAEIQVRYPDWYQEWKAGTIDGFPEGESFAAFDERVGRGFDRVLAEHPTGDLLVVVHKGIISCALRHLLGWSRDRTAEQSIDLGSVSILRDDGTWSFDQLNRLPD